MKLSKKLVVTGLLFSSVLGSVNVGSITAMAAEGTSHSSVESSEDLANKDSKGFQINLPEVTMTGSNKKIVRVIFYSGGDIKTVNVEVDDKTKSITIDKEDIPTGYRIRPHSDMTVQKNEKGDYYFVRVLVQRDYGDETTDSDSEVITTPTPTPVPTPSPAPSPAPTNPSTDINNDKKSVKVIFVSEDNIELASVEPSNVDVVKDAKEILSSDVTAPAGYEIIPSQKVSIKTTAANTDYAKIKIRKTNADSDKTTDTIKLNYVDAKGFNITDSRLPKTINVEKNSTKVSLKNVKLSNGYKFVNNVDPMIKDGSATIAIQKAEVVNVNVIYVDKDTKKVISKVKLTGTSGTANKLDIPAGYKVVDGSSNVVKFNKGVAEVTVVIEKVVPIKSHNCTIATYFGNSVSLYDSKGKMIKNRALSENSTWSSDKTMVLNGETYYRVATNEWLKAEDAYEYVGKKLTVTTKPDSYKALYTIKGKEVKSRGLSANSSWASDRATTINGEKMYRVATNEWVKASDIK